MEHLDSENAYLLGNKVGSILQVKPVDVNKSYLRVQVEFDLEAPLQPGFYLPRAQGPPVWIVFKYERLSSLCLVCGSLTHTMGTCIDDDHPYQFASGEEMRGLVPLDDLGPMSMSGMSVGMKEAMRVLLKATVDQFS